MTVRYHLSTVCDTCPWRKDTDHNLHPKAYIERMEESCQEGFNAVYICVQHSEMQLACVGYLLSPDSEKNFNVQTALLKHRFDPSKLTSDAPLFHTYAELATAYDVHVAAPVKTEHRLTARERCIVRDVHYRVRASWPLHIEPLDWIAILGDDL